MKTFSNAIGLMLGVSATSLIMGSPARAQHSQVYRFDVPSQSLDSALRSVAHTAHANILFDGREVATRRSVPVNGMYTVQEALDRMIIGSSLTVDRGAGDVYSVRHADRPTPRRASMLTVPVRPSPASPPLQTPTALQSDTTDAPPADIVVRGYRASLAAAASIKRNSPNVVDSIVADDIGKLPDVTTAAALQRVPGVQVTVGADNEIGGPIIRGLGDISSTVNGREIFTGVGRTFAFQDLPAEALAGADVYKSNSANLLEGGVAGTIDLRLHRAFDFKKLTIAGTARATYGDEAGVKNRVDPTIGLLVADRWNTGIGEIGALVDVSFSRTHYARPITFNDYARSFDEGPAGAAGYELPTGFGSPTEYGEYQRPQANFSLQWQASPDLQVYTEGLYAGYRTNYSRAVTLFDNWSASEIKNVKGNDDCADYAVGPNGYTSNDVQSADNPNGTGRIEHLCSGQSFDAVNPYALENTWGRHSKTDTYLIAGGFKYDHGPLSLNTDISYEKSQNFYDSFWVATGKRVPLVHYVRNDDNHATVTVPGDPLMDPDGLAFTNSLTEERDLSRGQLFAVKADATYDIGGFLKNIQVGARYAHRDSDYRQYLGNTPAPGGNYALAIADAGLPADFLVEGAGVPGRNDGGALIPDAAYLRSAEGQATIRQIFGLSGDVPDYQANRNYDATERSYAGYLQAAYQAPLGDSVSVDGLLGARLTRTDRDISGAGLVTDPQTGASTPVPVDASTSDTYLLPNASARLRFGQKLQVRFNYAKTLSRPDFGSLNPGVSYTISYVSTVRSSGSAGNPDLKPETANSFDGTVEYYFSRNAYLAVAAYYKDISNRLIQDTELEEIDGETYAITRPRNLGSATLKGVEISGQVFADFLPGLLSGFGVSGNFTLADSKITTDGDRLQGLPLLGVSKYNYTTALLYEKGGLSARLVYTHRSKYYDGDDTGVQAVRPIDTTVLLNGVRASGRLDFSVNYDFTPNVTVSLSGTNINKGRYASYIGNPNEPRDYRYDDSTYSVGVRFKF